MQLIETNLPYPFSIACVISVTSSAFNIPAKRRSFLPETPLCGDEAAASKCTYCIFVTVTLHVGAIKAI
ncbi:MAG: hypothetical protein OIN84_15795 [Candidatus Methanoperedens sp.]|uniref:hypothetical protein n=1 Tax=Candidatus Methanoperedens sp. BLZ2 TaxID=2035255 RepID=UPI00114399A1|nr:hypothetical protein [Candidatus Methanoperedens sp. BLZ2]MBZ0175284.1 hypothetical protein [Candidatus Methanoperedens nitroreducens]MCX9079427.1 hypothetical protein [Candidatus Methanoperedens sp.]